MSGYIKYFDNGGKNMSFKIEEGSVCLKYTEIVLNVKFHSQPIYDDKYIKTKVKHSIIQLIHSSQEMKSVKHRESLMHTFLLPHCYQLNPILYLFCNDACQKNIFSVSCFVPPLST